MQPLSYRLNQTAEGRGVLASFSQPQLADPVLWLRMDLPESRWQLHLLHDISHNQSTSHWVIAAGGLWLVAALLVLYIRQRQRLAAPAPAQPQRIGNRVAPARTGAAHRPRRHCSGRQAGRNRPPAACSTWPQGVVVVDPQLRLVAWNSRYIELFRYPPELMRVGQPIETLIRHNAKRGLLGKGDVDQGHTAPARAPCAAAARTCMKVPRAMARCWKLRQPIARRRFCHQDRFKFIGCTSERLEKFFIVLSVRVDYLTQT